MERNTEGPQEREAQLIRSGLLRDAYQRHFEDLLGIAELLRGSAKLPSPSGILAIADRRTEMLHEGLRSHIPESPLWRACRDWKLHSQRLEDIAADTKTWLGDMVNQTYPGAESKLDLGGWIDSLWSAITMTNRGEPFSEMQYQMVQTDKGPSLQWGSYVLSGGVEEAAFPVIQKNHEQMVQQVTTGDMASRLSDEHRLWARARDTIEEEIEVLVLRRLLPGRCRLCPGEV